MDRYLQFTWLFAIVVSLVVFALGDRYDRKTREARNNLKAPVDTDKLDRLAAAMLRDDPWAETDRAFCSEYGIDFDGRCPGSAPMRPFDPAPHTYPRRPARHGSRNRLHRGF